MCQCQWQIKLDHCRCTYYFIVIKFIRSVHCVQTVTASACVYLHFRHLHPAPLIAIADHAWVPIQIFMLPTKKLVIIRATLCYGRVSLYLFVCLFVTSRSSIEMVERICLFLAWMLPIGYTFPRLRLSNYTGTLYCTEIHFYRAMLCIRGTIV